MTTISKMFKLNVKIIRIKKLVEMLDSVAAFKKDTSALVFK